MSINKKQRKIFISGIQGYIGTVLAQTLRESGFLVVGLDAGFYKDALLYKDESIDGLGIVVRDIRMVTKDDLVGADAVIHLAEFSNDPLAELNPRGVTDVSREGTKHLAEAARAAGVSRFIYFSSCSVYGLVSKMVDETVSPNPLTTYARMKAENERMLLGMASDDFSPIIFRNATVYGASPRMRFDLAVNSLAGYAWVDREITMESNGEAWRPFVHIRDVCDAAVSALHAPEASLRGQIINIGSSASNYQIKNIAAIIQEVMPEAEITFNKENNDMRSYRVDFSKAERVLPGFRCVRDVRFGIQELFRLFEDIGLDKKTFRSRMFSRLKQMNYLKDTGQIDDMYYWVKESIRA
ncbi:MAG: NAD-dependent dehydratase [Candidatus Niyogibacteria bacterium CG10_big_fil_rev_8_21_14_0_10_46_36]|uniref:NAD-dependent dehydratase n=1 Tax=Candidatus Niyogibacteria bacterium CG10_big_fil_rev_8_21_14_0_10_46_36 TaxID=1974726 RepID=A0A2H0TCL3_9BACT|nr:MAG: NAD-dependent dehydratase [Candidatus Niyogibacteria bacterium CG10_big_fil_rev_8_21_14_0_10_46_36]